MHFSDFLTEELQLPADTAGNEMLIRISGYRDIIVTNYKIIAHCTSEEIVIVGYKKTLRINGRDLQIITFSNREIRIKGILQEIRFEQVK